MVEDLKKIKNRKGPIEIKNIQELIRLGLAAGDHSRPYLTDKGDAYLKNPEKIELFEALEKL